MDDIDRAQRINEQLQADALFAHQRKTQAATESRTHCIDCEEPIPAARRKAIPGCKRCRDCQEIYEHWRPL
ncbi:TraR/DksA C4-type zinc finger protein [uncultured Desulfuromonas sp.]|uniref:TraR/DksA C4-type zinc finger protein n=1 Tax=uncultured Desulfuromonas sp. TaxID=181013 RepID=UPI002AAB56F9|nr:TraR/DksA C4-type zinc finger protein [uncultured Desulfuromonas sp.]